MTSDIKQGKLDSAETVPPTGVLGQRFSALLEGAQLPPGFIDSTIQIQTGLTELMEQKDIGNLSPSVPRTRSGSSFMGAFAVAISSAHRNSSPHRRYNPESLLRELDRASGLPAGLLDSVRRAERSIALVKRLPHPALRGRVKVEPLTAHASDKLVDNSPMARVIGALRSGSAIVMPVGLDDLNLPADIPGSRQPARWGAITGFRETLSLPSGENDVRTSRTVFAVGVALPKMGIVASLEDDVLSEQLDSRAQFAQVVTPVWH